MNGLVLDLVARNLVGRFEIPIQSMQISIGPDQHISQLMPTLMRAKVFQPGG